MAAIAPEDGATGWCQDLTHGEFRNQYTRIHFIL